MGLPPLASLRSAVSPLRGSARRLKSCQDPMCPAGGARCARGGDTSLRDQGSPGDIARTNVLDPDESVGVTTDGRLTVNVPAQTGSLRALGLGGGGVPNSTDGRRSDKLSS